MVEITCALKLTEAASDYLGSYSSNWTKTASTRFGITQVFWVLLYDLKTFNRRLFAA